MLFAEELISPGGPSAPVWAFLTAVTTVSITTLGVLLKAKSDAKHAAMKAGEAKDEATKAHKSAEKAQTNTANISNGFASSVLGKLERIQQSQQETDKAVRNIAKSVREHYQWHLENEDRKE